MVTTSDPDFWKSPREVYISLAKLDSLLIGDDSVLDLEGHLKLFYRVV